MVAILFNGAEPFEQIFNKLQQKASWKLAKWFREEDI